MQRASFALVTAGILASVVAGCGDDGSSTKPAATTSSSSAGVVRPWNTIESYDLPSGPHGGGPVNLAYDATGGVVASWGVAGQGGHSDSQLLPISPGGVAGTPTVRDRFFVAGPFGAPAGQGDVLESTRADTAVLSGLSTGRVTGEGQVVDEEEIVPDDVSPSGEPMIDQSGGVATMAVAEGGVAVLAWTELGTYDPDRDVYPVVLKAAVRPSSNGQFGETRTLSTGEGYGPGEGGIAAAVSKDGRVSVAAADGSYGPVQLWTGTVNGSFGEAMPLGESGDTNTVKTVITTTGRTIVAWGQYGHGEEPHSPWIVRAAFLAPGDTKPSRVDVVGPSKDVGIPSPGIELAAGPSGTALLAWTQYRGKRDSGNRIAEATARGRFGIAHPLPGDGIAGLAIRKDGATVVTTVDGDPSHAYAVARAPGAIVFGPTEPLAPSSVLDGVGPRPFYDPVSGRASVAWAEPAHAGHPTRLVVQTRERQ